MFNIFGLNKLLYLVFFLIIIFYRSFKKNKEVEPELSEESGLGEVKLESDTTELLPVPQEKEKSEVLPIAEELKEDVLPVPQEKEKSEVLPVAEELKEDVLPIPQEKEKDTINIIDFKELINKKGTDLSNDEWDKVMKYINLKKI